MSAFARRGNYGEIKPDKKNRLEMNPIPVLFITNVTIHILIHTAIFRNGIQEKQGTNPIFSKSGILPSAFALSSAAFSLFFPHHSAALPSDAGRLKGSPRAAAARRSAARCINRPLN